MMAWRTRRRSDTGGGLATGRHESVPIDGRQRTAASPRGDAGFTLVEVVVALGLFALIGAAGAGLVTTLLGVRRATAGRDVRLAAIDRALAIVGRDLDAIADAPLTGSARRIGFDHTGADGVGSVAYRLHGDRLERLQGGGSIVVLDHVAAARWCYLGAHWQDRWPADAAQATSWPSAVALDLDLVGSPAGHVRRVVDLVSRPVPVASSGGAAEAPLVDSADGLPSPANGRTVAPPSAAGAGPGTSFDDAARLPGTP